MTGLEKIIKQIELDAKETANSHLSDAVKQAADIVAKAKVDAKLELEKHEKQAKVRMENVIERAKSSCELETAKTVLKTKQDIISKVLDEAVNRLENLEEKEYFDVLVTLANKHRGKESYELCLNAKDNARIPSDFEAKLPSNIKLSSKSISIDSGFILVGSEIDENCSFKALFEDNLEQLQDVASSILFK